METPQTAPYRRILVASGGAPHSRQAVERAITLAVQFGAALDIVVVVPPRGALASLTAGIPGSGELDEQVAESALSVRQAHLTVVAEEARQRGLDVHEYLRQGGRPAEIILSVAAATGADLIVLGRRHISALSATVGGSVGTAVSRAAPVDVLIAR